MTETDTCLTGRREAPENVGYDAAGSEFVFRQPRDERELAAVLRAAWADLFDAYRFDGLSRWTQATALEWFATRGALVGDLDDRRANDADVAAGMRAAFDSFTSSELEAYMSTVLVAFRS